MYDYYDYGYDYSYGYDGAEALTGFAAFGIGMFIFWIICMGISVFTIICNWKIFKKAGKPGWAAIVPVYNIIVMLEIAELPMWYIALYFVPGANIYALIKTYIEIAHKFGKSTGFGVGMAFLTPIFAGILAFSKDANFVGSQNNVEKNYQQPSNMEQPSYQQPVMQQTSTMNQQTVVNPQSITPVIPVVEPMMNQVQQPIQENIVSTPSIEPVSSVQNVEPITPVQEFVVPQPTVEAQVQPTVNQNPTPSFCTNCGGPIIPGAKFCTKCGNRL